jgi:hypothetical protein
MLTYQEIVARLNKSTITVLKGERYGHPFSKNACGESIEFYFSLSDDWMGLYNYSDNSTHKICGISHLLGWDSVRVGVRRKKVEANSFALVACTHNFGMGEYSRMCNIKTGEIYYCKIFKNNDGFYSVEVSLVLADRNILLTSYVTTVSKIIFPRLSGTYVEFGSKASQLDLKTQLFIV